MLKKKIIIFYLNKINILIILYNYKRIIKKEFLIKKKIKKMKFKKKKKWILKKKNHVMKLKK